MSQPQGFVYNLYQGKNAIYDPSLLSKENATSNEWVFIIFLNEVMSVAMHVCLVYWFYYKIYKKKEWVDRVIGAKERNKKDLGPSSWKGKIKSS